MNGIISFHVYGLLSTDENNRILYIDYKYHGNVFWSSCTTEFSDFFRGDLFSVSEIKDDSALRFCGI
jgi:hypothetical protein